MPGRWGLAVEPESHSGWEVRPQPQYPGPGRSGLAGAVASGVGRRGVAVSFIQQGFQVGDAPVGLLQALDLAFRQDAVGGDDGPAFPFVLGGRLPVGIDAGQPVDQPLAVGAGHWASGQQPQAPQVAHRVADGTVGGVQPLGQGLLGRAALAGLKVHQQSIDRDGLGRVVGVAGDLPEHNPMGQVQAGAGFDGPTVDGGAAQGSRYGGWRLLVQELRPGPLLWLKVWSRPALLIPPPGRCSGLSWPV